MSHWSAYHTALLTAIVMSIVYVFNQSNKVLLDLSVALSPIVVFGALLMALVTVIQLGVRREDRITVVWFNFMLALFLWFLSEVVFGWYLLAIGTAPPYPSLSEVLALVGYLPLLIGLLMLMWPFRETFARWKMRTVIAIVTIVSILALYILLPPIFRQGQNFAGLLVSLAYPILDFIALSIAVPSLVMFMRGTFWRPCLLLLIGLVLASAADVVFGWAILSGTYYLGHPLELIYDLAFLSAALGFYLRRKQFMTKSL